MKNILEEIGADVKILSQAEIKKAEKDAKVAIKRAAESGLFKSKEQADASLEATFKKLILKEIEEAKAREAEKVNDIKLCKTFKVGDKVTVVSIKETKSGYGHDASVMESEGESFIIKSIGDGFIMNQKGYAFNPNDLEHFTEKIED